VQLPPLPDKDFFTMGEICRIAQIPPHTLRYWEKNFGALRPARRSSGHRRYGRHDVELIFKIKGLLADGMTVAGAKKALKDKKRAQPDLPFAGDTAALRLLREVRRELQLLVEELAK
jgi:DNA-binding transcriptional MerR regulator